MAQVSTRAVQHEGRAYKLAAWTPATHPPAEGFPVIIILDGDELFLSAAEAMRRLSRFPDRTGVAPAIIIGVNPQRETNESDAKSRFRYYTFGPPADVSLAPQDAEGGEGNALLNFLTDVLPPILTEYTRINRARIALYGHSLSAYFALNAVAQRPNTFHAIAAISPSLWWDEQRVLTQASNLKAKRIFLVCGEQETTATDNRRTTRAMLPRLKTLAAALNITTQILPNEDHGSTATAALSQSLRFLSIP